MGLIRFTFISGSDFASLNGVMVTLAFGLAGFKKLLGSFGLFSFGLFSLAVSGDELPFGRTSVRLVKDPERRCICVLEANRFASFCMRSFSAAASLWALSNWPLNRAMIEKKSSGEVVFGSSP